MSRLIAACSSATVSGGVTNSLTPARIASRSTVGSSSAATRSTPVEGCCLLSAASDEGMRLS